jgi:hypothetical protein
MPIIDLTDDEHAALISAARRAIDAGEAPNQDHAILSPSRFGL